jgi:hypothetical protein
MRKTLEAMYYDNLSIAGRGLDKKSEYYKAERAVCEIACELEETLTSQQKEIWDRYVSANMKASNLSCCDNFVLGFRTAANLLVEALVDCSDDSTFPIEG